MSDTLIGWAAFIVVAGSMALWFRAILRVEIPTNRTFFVAAWMVGGVLAVLALLGDAGIAGRLPAWFAVSTAGVLLLLVSISKQKLGDDAIAVGDTIPEFTAIDEHGENFDSQSLAGHLTLIKFFRAHW